MPTNFLGLELRRTGPSAETESRVGARPRLSGVDVARVIAIAGMVMVHFGPNPVPGTTPGRIYEFSHGRASILFALLAGVGVALLIRRRFHDQIYLGRARILLRALLLLPIGLWLQSLDHSVLVILQYYALYFVFATLVIGLPDRWLIAGAVIALVFGPIIYLGGEALQPEWYRDEPSTLGDPPGKLTRDLLLSGAYPLVTWAAPLLVGVWVGRRDLLRSTTQWLMVGIGTAVALLAALVARSPINPSDPQFADLLTNEPHSQMPLWMIGSIGSALAILGGALLGSNWLGRIVWPLVAAGQLALSIYVGHLILLHLYPVLVEREEVTAAFVSVGVFMLVTIALCTLWRTIFPRGPMEALLGAPGLLLERMFATAKPQDRSPPRHEKP